jgi:hypothetical protein
MQPSSELDRDTVLDALPAGPPPLPVRRPSNRFLSFLGTTLGWAWRLAVGVACGMSYVGAVLLVGWLNRLVQGRVLYGWWKQSALSREGTFEDFTATLGHDAPTRRPRWLLRESFSRGSLRSELKRPTADGDPPGWLRQLGRVVRAPFASLVENLKLGVLTVVATFMVAGWGTFLMTFSWEFGWLNSFTKGYEAYYVGPLTGVAGLLLFTAAMLYVPMAQVHLAVTGDFRAFFEFRFVWRLIRARLTAYVLLAVLFAGLGWVQEVLKILPYYLHNLPAWENASDRALYGALQQYYLGCSAYLLFALLATRLLAARIYRSAVLKVLRRGRADRDMVHPRLAGWLDRLGLYPEPEPARGAVERVVRATGRWTYRRVLFAALFLAWLAFSVKVYLGEFLNYHPYAGFANQPLVQVPCVNYTPAALAQAAKEG